MEIRRGGEKRGRSIEEEGKEVKRKQGGERQFLKKKREAKYLEVTMGVTEGIKEPAEDLRAIPFGAFQSGSEDRHEIHNHHQLDEEKVEEKGRDRESMMKRWKRGKEKESESMTKMWK